jgi:hypothetical protein
VRLVALVPKEANQLLAPHRARGATREVGEERELLAPPAQDLAVPSTQSELTESAKVEHYAITS